MHFSCLHPPLGAERAERAPPGEGLLTGVTLSPLEHRLQPGICSRAEPFPARMLKKGLQGNAQSPGQGTSKVAQASVTVLQVAEMPESCWGMEILLGILWAEVAQMLSVSLGVWAPASLKLQRQCLPASRLCAGDEGAGEHLWVEGPLAEVWWGFYTEQVGTGRHIWACLWTPAPGHETSFTLSCCHKTSLHLVLLSQKAFTGNGNTQSHLFFLEAGFPGETCPDLLGGHAPPGLPCILCFSAVLSQPSPAWSPWALQECPALLQGLLKQTRRLRGYLPQQSIPLPGLPNLRHRAPLFTGKIPPQVAPPSGSCGFGSFECTKRTHMAQGRWPRPGTRLAII